MTTNLNNTVIKVLNAEHGKKVIQWWKDQGVDTFNFEGDSIDGYYGLVNNKFDYYFYSPHGSKVIELPDIVIPEERMYSRGEVENIIKLAINESKTSYFYIDKMGLNKWIEKHL